MSRLRRVVRAFDAAARDYEASARRDPVLALIKRRALDRFAARLRPGARVLDLGCGPGLDAAALAARGFRVTAVDAAPAMAALARRRLSPWIRRGRAQVRCATAAAAARRAAGRFDGVWAFWLSAFEPSSRALARHCAAALRPGGVAAFTVPGRTPAWEMAAALARGDAAGALRRLRSGGVEVRVGDRPVRVWAPSWQAVLAPFRRPFRLVEAEPLGLFLPPPHLRRGRRGPPAWLRRLLDRLEAAARGTPLVRLADHVLVILIKR